MIRTVFVLVALTLLAGMAVADEGMWMINRLDQAPYDVWKQAGLQLDPKQIFDPKHPAVSDAIVQVGGGTGSFVSADGLIVTNHHVVKNATETVVAFPDGTKRQGKIVGMDEIGDIGPRVQVDLLRVLEEKSVTRVGGRGTIPIDFRIVAATNRDLEAMVKDGSFREDLYYRLNVVGIEIPPLRERPQDIPTLTQYFLERFSKELLEFP